MLNTNFLDCQFVLGFATDQGIQSIGAWINASINHCTFSQGGELAYGIYIGASGNGTQGLRIIDTLFIGLSMALFNNGPMDQLYFTGCMVDYCTQALLFSGAGGVAGLTFENTYFGVPGTAANDCVLYTELPVGSPIIFSNCTFVDYNAGSVYFNDTSGAVKIQIRDSLNGIIPAAKFVLAAGSTWEQSTISEHITNNQVFQASSGLLNGGNFSSSLSGGYTSFAPAAATWLQNASGGPLFVSVTAEIGTNGFASLTVNSTNAPGGAVVDQFSNANTGNIITTLQAIVPAGLWYYIATTGTVTLTPSGYPSYYYRML